MFYLTVMSNTAFVLSIVLVTLSLFNIVLGLFNIKSSASFMLLIFLMWMIHWSNNSNVDYVNYVNYFNNINLSTSILDFLSEGELGFYISIWLFKLLQMDYHSYLFLMTGISYWLLVIGLKRINSNLNLVLGLYFFMPYFLDVVQIRNFIGTSIFIWAIPDLISKKYNPKLYLFKILLSASFHYIYILYLPLLFYKYLNRRNNEYFFFFFISSLLLITYLNNKKIPFIEEIVSVFTSDDRIFQWLGNTTNLGFLLYWIIPITFFLVSFLLFYKSNQKSNFLNKNLFHFNLFLLFQLSFYFYASTFNRLARNLYFFQYSQLAFYNKKNKFQGNIILSVFVILIFIIPGYYIYLDYYFESVVIDALSNNIIVTIFS
jgi:hypothetical protein